MGKSLLPFIFAFAVSFPLALPVHAEIIESVEAAVNGRVITKSDLEEDIAIRRMLGEDAERGRALDALIERKLAAAEAGRLGLTVSAEEVTAGVLRFEGTFPSGEDFNRFLDAYEMTLQDLSRRFASSLTVEKVREQKEAASPGRYEKWLSEAREKADIRIVDSQ